MFSFLFQSVAFAQTAAGAPAGEQPSMLMSLVPFAFLFGAMYFLVLRPQAKKQKEHQQYVTALKRGDEVVTTSGILGRVEGIADAFVTLEVADNVRVKILKTQIAGSQSQMISGGKA